MHTAHLTLNQENAHPRNTSYVHSDERMRTAMHTHMAQEEGDEVSDRTKQKLWPLNKHANTMSIERAEHTHTNTHVKVL